MMTLAIFRVSRFIVWPGLSEGLGCSQPGGWFPTYASRVAGRQCRSWLRIGAWGDAWAMQKRCGTGVRGQEAGINGQKPSNAITTLLTPVFK